MKTNIKKSLAAFAAVALVAIALPSAVYATVDQNPMTNVSSSNNNGGDDSDNKDGDDSAKGGKGGGGGVGTPVPEMNAVLPLAALAVTAIASQVWRKRREAGEQA